MRDMFGRAISIEDFAKYLLRRHKSLLETYNEESISAINRNLKRPHPELSRAFGALRELELALEVLDIDPYADEPD